MDGIPWSHFRNDPYFQNTRIFKYWKFEYSNYDLNRCVETQFSTDGLLRTRDHFHWVRNVRDVEFEYKHRYVSSGGF